MTLLQILIDNTNYEWEYDETGVIAVWVEDGQSLGVNAWFDLEAGDGTIVVMNEMVSDYYVINNDEYDLLPIATEYAQFSTDEHFGNLGNADQFRAYVAAWQVLGGDFSFSATQDGIVLNVGNPWVWCDWNGERYDLFWNGCHRYAVTAEGLKRAYRQLVLEVEAIETAMAKQQLQKTES